MTKVVIDMSMSLDGFVAGPDDSKDNPLGRHGGMHVFDWYFSGGEEYRNPLLRPEPGTNRNEVERMFAEKAAPSSSAGERTRSRTVGAAATR